MLPKNFIPCLNDYCRSTCCYHEHRSVGTDNGFTNSPCFIAVPQQGTHNVEFNNLVYHITKHIKTACKGTKKRRIFRNFVPNYYDTLRRLWQRIVRYEGFGEAQGLGGILPFIYQPDLPSPPLLRETGRDLIKEIV